MLVFSKARLVLLSVPKTGSTAYEAALAPLAAIVVSSPPELKHAPVFRYNRFFRPMIDRFFEGRFDVVAVMREPLDWLGSWYRYRQRPEMTGHPNSTQGLNFDDFVLAYCASDQPEFARVGSQAKFLEPQRNGTCVTHLFRYEDQAGLQRFLEMRLGINVAPERLNRSPEVPLSLSPTVEARVRRNFADEFSLWTGIGSAGAFTPLCAKVKPDPAD